MPQGRPETGRPTTRRDPNDGLCWNCDKPGHKAFQCKEPRRPRQSPTIGAVDEVSGCARAKGEEASGPIEFGGGFVGALLAVDSEPAGPDRRTPPAKKEQRRRVRLNTGMFDPLGATAGDEEEEETPELVGSDDEGAATAGGEHENPPQEPESDLHHQQHWWSTVMTRAKRMRVKMRRVEKRQWKKALHI